MTPHLADTPVLETERLTLRAPVLADADNFVAFYGSERSTHVGGPLTPRAAWNFFATELGHWALRGFGMFSAVPKGSETAIAMVGHWQPVDWPEREVGWLVLDPDCEGKGIAHEAARACVDHAYRVLGWDTVVSYIDPRNARSIALARRLGAQRDDDATPPMRREADLPAALVFRHPVPGAA
ncbi:GNAT family N-acetyltransferase [Silicimonas algicola]|uniref:RimJ/RimL family protein N-acetyltransferase n=1 Tax=Silicimonas algicola TaxID=1826607 RepID=A0A316GDX7_9RHOB|nr:GNAT family N-acetyltransferase [Silicimonas algicola]PWK58435.1 RimJ/RimL family protein N-acetyltransferase [Silicimonas algicola]